MATWPPPRSKQNSLLPSRAALERLQCLSQPLRWGLLQGPNTPCPAGLSSAQVRTLVWRPWGSREMAGALARASLSHQAGKKARTTVGVGSGERRTTESKRTKVASICCRNTQTPLGAAFLQGPPRPLSLWVPHPNRRSFVHQSREPKVRALCPSLLRTLWGCAQRQQMVALQPLGVPAQAALGSVVRGSGVPGRSQHHVSRWRR